MDQQSYTPQGGPTPPASQAGKGMAIAALVLGILSIIDPTLIFGIIAGVVGIVLAVLAKKQGFTGGIATAGLVLSIIGVALNALILILCGSMIAALGDPLYW